MDFSQLNEDDRNRMMQFLEQKQAKDAVQTYMNLVEKCFGDCIDDFTSRAMSSKETTCIDKCADKFLKFSSRLGLRFNEEMQKLQQQQQQ
ncbi:hypothetical protein MP638_003807 [Amoeboaphelidium occidentale]|nr:hypothetical protein MP638_003807 [Amoeboaphelidium occidentale]